MKNLETFKKCVFLRRYMGLSINKYFLKIGKSGQFAVECVSTDNIS